MQSKGKGDRRASHTGNEQSIITKGTIPMRIKPKRVGALLLATLLSVFAAGKHIPSASAEEIERTDAYVLNYNSSDLGGDYAYTQPYLYGTPFMVNHSITDENGDYYYSGNNHPEVFNLINTTKLNAGGDGTYASIAAYCTDASTGIRDNFVYRRINLEDSTYYESGAAGRIRAVVLRAFPYMDVESIQTSANIWLKAQGLPEVTNLQSGEAILAAQTAIWKLANADHYEVLENYSGCTQLSESYLSDTVFKDSADQAETEYSAQNITGLYEYYRNLDGETARYDAVSESTIEKPVYTSVMDADGHYTITVSANIQTDVREADRLTLTATCQDQIQSTPISASGEYSFTFAGVADRVEVLLEINGYQGGGDVYLFDAEGNRDASQTLVGYDSSILPVHAEITVTPNRVVNILKTTSEEDSSIPLANIAFDIYQVATMEDLALGKVTISQQPTDAEKQKYQTAENHVVTLVTNVQGMASFDFTANGYPDGVYLVVEQFNPATTGVIKPFYLAVPGTTEDGSGHIYTLNVNPKNVTETGPDIQKDVTKLDNNSDTFDVGQIHTWIIRSDIPSGISNAQKYVITDVLDYRLTYEKESPVVKLYTKAGTEIVLEKDVHYVLTEGSVEDGVYLVDRFQIALTTDGMKYVAEHLGTGESKPELRVYFNAVINENASMGSTIPNDAHLDYTNSAGVDYEIDSDIPGVHTGGIHIQKTDAEDVPLAGASFKIAREATEAELEDESVKKEILSIGSKNLAVVFVDFHATEDLSDERVYEVTTDAGGKAVIYGLAYGEYYLVETKAPAGYNLLSQPLQITINEASHLTATDGWQNEDGEIVDNTLHVINTKFILPDTGGIGTTVFTAGGSIVIGAACILLLSNRKKRV